MRSVEQTKSVLDIIERLTKGFVDIQPSHIRKCIRHVEEKSFPVALQRGNLQLKDTVKEFKILTVTTNSNVVPTQSEFTLNSNEVRNEDQRVFIPFPRAFMRRNTQINTQNDSSDSESSVTLGFLSQSMQSSHFE